MTLAEEIAEAIGQEYGWTERGELAIRMVLEALYWEARAGEDLPQKTPAQFLYDWAKERGLDLDGVAGVY